MACTHITEEQCVTRVPKEMFKKKAEIEASDPFFGGNSNNPDKKAHNVPTFCVECDLSKSSLICLNCGIINCGRYDSGHAIDHFNESKHAVVMDCVSFALYCYECDATVTVDFEPALFPLIKSIRLLFDIEEPIGEEEVKTVTDQVASSKLKSPPPKGGKKDKKKEKNVKHYGLKSGKVVPMTPQIAEIIRDGKPRGLNNVGNTCFMASALQALGSIEQFVSYMCDMPDLEDYLIDPTKTQVSFVSNETRNFFRKLRERTPKNVPHQLNLFRKVFVTHCPRFQGLEQHDSHEFLRYLLDQMHTEMKKCQDLPDIPEGSTFINELFGGTLQSKVICMNCQHESNKDDVMMDLSLDLKHKAKLPDALNSFFAKEILDKTEKPECSKCKSKQTSSKQMFIKKLPQVLCLHLKRFRDDGSKSCKHVNFLMDGLNLDHFMSDDIPEEPPTFYELTSTVQHCGENTGFGHYICYGKRGSSWYMFNDEKVELSQPENVLGSYAYILFYTKKPTSAPNPTPSTTLHSLNLPPIAPPTKTNQKPVKK
ncbi:unnamed protein product [Caenorhabditis angaria]|uniref:Ubiquitin carboxyl-terminal hydrolase n=1 Tax=Caenorhabditis angaria TaxID=860376 RepID=A0A9P1MSF7_9PELO|nr:unnamed protein product [Caenorhabditis angaria]